MTSTEELLNDIAKSLGRLEGKQDGMCQSIKELRENQKKIHDKIDMLPCEDHVKYFSKITQSKISDKIFLRIIAVIVIVIIGSYSYTNIVDHSLHEHELDTEVHFKALDPNWKYYDEEINNNNAVDKIKETPGKIYTPQPFGETMDEGYDTSLFSEETQ